MQEDIDQLKQDVEELKRWKATKENQQITFPLDNYSVDVLNRYFMRLTAVLSIASGAAGHTFISYVGKQDNISSSNSPAYFEIQQSINIQYVVDPSTDTLTITNSYIRFNTGDQVSIAADTSGVVPAGLTSGATYYVISSDGQNFKLSTSLGGSAVNITDAGSGNQYIYFL